MKSTASKFSWRQYKFRQFIKPPSSTLNVNRKKVKKLIAEIANQDGRILDLGSGGRKLAPQIVNFDIDRFDNVHLIGDAHQLPFKNGSFQLILVTAVLEHVQNPQLVVNEIQRCLQPGGIVYAESPFLQGYHADPHDYQRFTKLGLNILFKDFSLQETGACIGPISVLTWYFRKLPTTFFSNIYLIKGMEFITGWLCFLFKYLDYIFIKAKNAHILASGLYFIGKKVE
jgi:SAM-dependent methyltransferase